MLEPVSKVRNLQFWQAIEDGSYMFGKQDLLWLMFELWLENCEFCFDSEPLSVVESKALLSEIISFLLS
jgi:hypothetical protein